MSEIPHSGYLDAGSWRLADPQAKNVAQALGLTDIHDASPQDSITLAVMAERANDPTAMLGMTWAERQTTLASLAADGELWNTYGGKPNDYARLKTVLSEHGTLLGSSEGYIENDTRTVWVTLTPEAFGKVFGTALKTGITAQGQAVQYWDGNLSSDVLDVPVGGLMLKTVASPVKVAAQIAVTEDDFLLRAGPQSIGNASERETSLFPNQVAELYNFPLANVTAATATVGILAPGSGASVESSDIQTLVDDYREAAGVSGSGRVSGDAVAKLNQSSGGERALDIGVLSTAAPNSDLVLYAGAGSTVSAIQNAIWDDTQRIDVLSISYGLGIQPSPDSPFHRAYAELGVDAALRNITVLNSSGDGGSGDQRGSGVPMVDTATGSPYVVMVGGTSIASTRAAGQDVTLLGKDGWLEKALQHDPQTLYHLIATGLRTLPSVGADGDLVENGALFETVWNEYNYQHYPDRDINRINYTANLASGGGVDATIPQPSYQTDYGLNLRGAGPFADTGRGRPDVSALAGGDAFYRIPNRDLTFDSHHPNGSKGTSASAPLWAAFMAKVDTIFADQGLPALGYGNDLLYQAAAIAPGAYNDIANGNITSSYVSGGDIFSLRNDHIQAITPTGFGYEAHEGYDLTTGLGSPNGVLLARALTTIAHAQTSSDAPGMLASDETSAITQHLLVQARGSGDAVSTIDIAGENFWFEGATDSLAWSSSMAQKALQADFDPALVRLFDGAAQVTPHDLTLAAGETVAVDIDGQTATTFRETLTNPFGFVDYRIPHEAGSTYADVTLARSVAIAQTANGADDQDAIVRLRSNAGNTTNDISFYKVDDLAGHIGALAPGDAGYAAAAAARAYVSETGASVIAAPTEGGYAQHRLSGIDHDDMIAMRLTDGSNTFWGFSAANELGADGHATTHLWSYGLNTWGWEDMVGGGDKDFNDLLVQLDFTSAAGSGWLV